MGFTKAHHGHPESTRGTAPRPPGFPSTVSRMPSHERPRSDSRGLVFLPPLSGLSQYVECSEACCGGGSVSAGLRCCGREDGAHCTHPRPNPCASISACSSGDALVMRHPTFDTPRACRTLSAQRGSAHTPSAHRARPLVAPRTSDSRPARGSSPLAREESVDALALRSDHPHPFPSNIARVSAIAPTSSACWCDRNRRVLRTRRASSAAHTPTRSHRVRE